MTRRRKSPVEIDTVEAHLCTIDLRLEILARLPFLEGLGRAELEAVNRRFRERGYSAGETIYFSGDAAEHLYVVASGQVRLLQHSQGGKDVLLDVLIPGEFFGSLATGAGERYRETAQAQTPVCVLSIATSDFRQVLAQHPEAALAVLDLTAGRLQAAQTRVRELSAYPVEQRIAAVLLRLLEKVGEDHPDGILIQAPLSREDLAQMSGTTPETVSRILSGMQKDGLIESGRQWVAVRDAAALARVARGD